MSCIINIQISAALITFLATSGAYAQWKQLPVPSINARIGIGADGSLWAVTNGTVCISDTGKQQWMYQPFPYDLAYGILPPRQLVMASPDTLLFICGGELFSFVQGEQSLQFALGGLRPDERFGEQPYFLTSRGKKGELFLCYDHLYESTNNGLSWELRYRNPTPGRTFSPGAVDERNRDVMFLWETGPHPNVHKSTDNGATWSVVPTNTTRERPEDMLVGPDGQIHAGMFLSRDYGENWTWQTMDTDCSSRAELNHRYLFDEKAQGTFALNVYHGLFFKALGNHAFRRMALASCTIEEEPRRGVDLAGDAARGGIYAIINDSLYEYKQGEVKPLTHTVFAAGISDIESYSRQGDTLLFITPNTVVKSTDAGWTWSDTPMGGGGGTLTIAKRTKNLIYRYSNYGPQIDIYENERYARKSISYGTDCRLVYDPFSTDTFYGSNVRLWKMTDSCVLAANPKTMFWPDEWVGTPSAFRYVQCMSFDARRKGVLMIGGVTEKYTPILARTTDLGNSWDLIESIPLKEPQVFEILFDPAVEGRILVFDPAGVYISSDDGETWEYRDPGLGVRKATCVAIDSDNPAEIFLGVSSPNRPQPIPQSADEGGGIWRSRDGGDTWRKLPIEGLFNYNITDVELFRHPRRLLVGTPCGAYEYLLDSTSSMVPQENTLESGVRMEINPNPARGNVRIDCSLDAPARVRIVVYDILGRMVASVPENAASAGTHTISLDVGGLKDGMYIVTLETRTQIYTRRMMVLR